MVSFAAGASGLARRGLARPLVVEDQGCERRPTTSDGWIREWSSACLPVGWLTQRRWTERLIRGHRWSRQVPPVIGPGGSHRRSVPSGAAGGKPSSRPLRRFGPCSRLLPGGVCSGSRICPAASRRRTAVPPDAQPEPCGERPPVSDRQLDLYDDNGRTCRRPRRRCQRRTGHGHRITGLGSGLGRNLSAWVPAAGCGSWSPAASTSS